MKEQIPYQIKEHVVDRYGVEEQRRAIGGAELSGGANNHGTGPNGHGIPRLCLNCEFRGSRAVS